MISTLLAGLCALQRPFNTLSCVAGNEAETKSHPNSAPLEPRACQKLEISPNTLNRKRELKEEKYEKDLGGHSPCLWSSQRLNKVTREGKYGNTAKKT